MPKPIVKNNRPLTRKQQAFVKHLVNNPKDSATEAAAQSYNVKTRRSAEQIAYENLRKPEIMVVLGKHDINAQKVLAEALQANRKRAEITDRDDKGRPIYAYYDEPDHVTRVKAADSILDRLHGKATQRTEVKSQAIQVTIDLTGGQYGQPNKAE